MERINNAPCGYIILDANGVIKYINRTLLVWLDREHEDFKGKHIESLLSNVSKIMFYSYFYPTIAIKKSVDEMLIKLTTKDGLSKPFVLNARNQRGKDEQLIDCAFMQMDKRVNYEKELWKMKKDVQLALQKKEEAFQQLEQIYQEIALKQKELQIMNENLEKLSNLDQLTGVYNRHFSASYLKEQIKKVNEEQYVFSLIILDIDYFKHVNDTYGHLAGDLVLSRLGMLLKEYIHQQGVVIRYGGEEFIIILPNKNKEQAIEIANYLNRLVEQELFVEVGHITISLGISTAFSNDTVTTIFKRADDALYIAKHSGRNQVCHINDV